MSALQRLWTDKMDIEEYKPIDKPNGSTGFGNVLTQTDIPCRLSYSYIKEAGNSDAAKLVQVVKLFLSPIIKISSGSKVIVKRHTGDQLEFKQSGEPAIYTNHQEIVLVPYKEKS